ncbi:MAG: 5'-nucleotidase [Lachnospiraceae bacterium]|nr:5'-nucleotidase [Lachnospiraceae bacterium]
MAGRLDAKMVIGVSTRALFDMTVENEIFESRGVDAYCEYQVAHEQEILKPGPGFRLIQSLLRLNDCAARDQQKLVEVIVMSRNSPDTSLRVFNAIRHYNLPITRAVLVSGASLAPYLAAFRTDLFLSAYEDDVQCAIDSGIAAGIICTEPGDAGKMQQNKWTAEIKPFRENHQIRIAFDGDAVLFSDESERIFKEKGLGAFEENESRHARCPMKEGPFASFLKKLSDLQAEIGREQCPIRTALVTARCAPAHERVIRTLRSWNVRVDEAFFLGGLDKKEFLKAFQAQIFFDDQSVNTESAANVVPAARVPYRRNGKRELYQDEISAYRTG